MAKPIPQIKRPTIPLDVANRFINGGLPASDASPGPAQLSVVPSAPVMAESQPATDETTPQAAPSMEATALASDAPSSPVSSNVDLAIEKQVRPNSPRPRTASSNGRALTTRADGEAVRKVTFYLPPDLDVALSVHCASSGLDRSDVVVNALRRALK